MFQEKRGVLSAATFFISGSPLHESLGAS